MKVFRLPFTHSTPPAAARQFVRRALSARSLRGDVTGDVLLVTTELVQNVIEHTGDGGELLVGLEHDAILIEVADNDPGPLQLPAPNPTSGRGRGLQLVGAIARRWGIRPRRTTGKVVWAELGLA
jgi:anti-sigma regulatory factor (Ser/Thr protein kinase)